MLHSSTQTDRGVGAVGWALAAWLVVSACPVEAFMAGADISGLPVFEDAGITYTHNGVAGDAIEILAAHGVGWQRLRLFVDPTNSSDDFVVNDLSYTIDLAKRVKAAGGKVLLDLHYSDTWADPGKQNKPQAWESLSQSQLTARVHDYTRDVLAAFKTEGVAPEMVQVGNEVSNGMLWDDGYLWGPGSNEPRLDRFAELLTAGINGAKEGAGPDDEPLIMVHHDRADLWARTSYFFDELIERNVDFDVIGYSYYPKWHYDPSTGAGGLDDVAENLNNSALAYGKPVVIAETGFASRGAQWEPTYEFPVTEEGQRQFLEALVDTVQAVPNGLGGGVFWWFAEAVPAWPLRVWEGGRYGLFDEKADLLSAASVFEEFLIPTLPGDFNSDGVVDAADYTVWRDGLGDTYELGDYGTWADHYGQTIAAPQSAIPGSAVPEPPAVALVLLALAGYAGRLRTAS
ncbi:Arabinogalactan endo-1,4-beta-galactosidase precursor [Botrimarina colliarenosi]|uniref:Arabinogalactan endo-beta-1,4-galactanase n=1 Tax=Botrimarina colliarenosi TaxID=2528001 RepID=A0A5C6A0B6_9BACT|nr:glycosyl hydrolase 53 family protein [Botrimarina colliarenosi]TWT92856.1 Arabinogalactan endo-1,4-beta-galactosidase precursor [Botrimarina colliarenosi]